MNFYVGISIALIAAAAIIYVMNKAQKRKEKAADDQFNLTLMSYGMKNEIVESEPEETIEVRDIPRDQVVLNKVVKKKKTNKKKVVKKKSKNKR